MKVRKIITTIIIMLSCLLFTIEASAININKDGSFGKFYFHASGTSFNSGLDTVLDLYGNWYEEFDTGLGIKTVAGVGWRAINIEDITGDPVWSGNDYCLIKEAHGPIYAMFDIYSYEDSPKSNEDLCRWLLSLGLKDENVYAGNVNGRNCFWGDDTHLLRRYMTMFLPDGRQFVFYVGCNISNDFEIAANDAKQMLKAMEIQPEYFSTLSTGDPAYDDQYGEVQPTSEEYEEDDDFDEVQTESYEDEWLSLEDYLSCSFDDILWDFPELVQTKKEADIEKWESDSISVTGTDHDHIVRIRLSMNDGDTCIYEIYPGMDDEDAQYRLSTEELKNETITEDGWHVFSSNDGKMVAYNLNQDNTLHDIYVALEGYLPISY